MVKATHKGSRGTKRALPVLVDEEVFTEKNKCGNLVYVTRQVKPEKVSKTTYASQSKHSEQSTEWRVNSLILDDSEDGGHVRGCKEKRKKTPTKVCHSQEI
jgi:hypothetical protein